MEADLLRFWQIDLLDYWRTPRRLSTRRLLVLVEHIPEGQGSAVRAIAGEWGPVEEILDSLRRWYVMVHSESHDDPGLHPRHPLSGTTDVAPSAEVVAHVARLKSEREAAIAAGELT